MSKISMNKRRNVFNLFDGHCGYCGDEIDLYSMHIDHITPVSCGGGNRMTNLMPSCSACNLSKGNTFLIDFKIKSYVKKCLFGVSFNDKQIFALQKKGILPSDEEIIEMELFHFERYTGINVMEFEI